MQTYENKGAEAFSNGSAGHMNGAELSRMREVAFEKNQSEPLVRRHTQTNVFYCTWVGFSHCLST